MKKIALCLMAAALCASSAGMAQDYRGDRYDRYDRYDDRGRYDRDDRYDYRDRDDFLPREYRRGRYVFDGWRERGLKRPGPDQEWIRICDSFILASMRTGRIEEVHMAGRGRVDNKAYWRLANSLRCRR